MKQEFEMNYKLRPDPERPPWSKEDWKVWTPCPRDWPEAGRALAEIGAKFNPVVVTTVCIESDE